MGVYNKTIKKSGEIESNLVEEEEEKSHQRFIGFEWQRGDLFVKGAEYT